MARKLLLIFVIGAAVAMASALAAEAAEEDIVYPVKELGNCADKDSCFKYCENPDNLKQCVAFAEKHNLLPEEELAKARKFQEIGGTGPGDCRSEAQCFKYCDDISHIDECVAFGEENGFLEGDELEEAKKVNAALKRGVQLPTGCTNKESCKQRCEAPPDVATAKACFAFAKEAGFLPPEFDEEKSERMFELIDRGEVDFRKMQKCEALDRGETLDEETISTCLDVGEKLGFIKSEEKEFAKRMMLEGGPNGCRGSQCKDVCENNPDVCLQYFEEKGIALPEEAQERISEGLEQMREALSEAPDDVIECLKTEIGADVFAQIETGTIRASQMVKLGPKMGQIMQGCFIKSFGSEEGFGPPGGFEGEFPGGPEGGFPGGTGGGMPEGVQECFTELGLQFPPRRPPSAEEQQRIGECMRERGGAPEGFGPPGDDHEGEFEEDFGPSGGFPGENGFLSGEFRSEDFEDFNGDGFPNPDQFMPPGAKGQIPGNFDPSAIQEKIIQEQIQKQIQEQTQQQFQEQFNQQYQQQLQQIQGQFPSQPGGFPTGGFDPSQFQPPAGNFPSAPPAGFDPSQFQPPPGGLPPSSYYYETVPSLNPPSLLGFFAQIIGL